TPIASSPRRCVFQQQRCRQYSKVCLGRRRCWWNSRAHQGRTSPKTSSKKLQSKLPRPRLATRCQKRNPKGLTCRCLQESPAVNQQRKPGNEKRLGDEARTRAQQLDHIFEW